MHHAMVGPGVLNDNTHRNYDSRVSVSWVPVYARARNSGVPARPRSNTRLAADHVMLLPSDWLRTHRTPLSAALLCLQLVAQCGQKWSVIASRLKVETGKQSRVGKQIRERYLHHLDPGLKKGGWTPAEVSFGARRYRVSSWSHDGIATSLLFVFQRFWDSNTVV